MSWSCSRARLLPESQANLREFALRWSAEARAHGARLALLTVWPESYRRSALTEVIASYRRAATTAKAELLPGGDAWRRAWHCEPGTPLYGQTGSTRPARTPLRWSSTAGSSRRRSWAAGRPQAYLRAPPGSCSGRPRRRLAGASRPPGAAGARRAWRDGARCRGAMLGSGRTQGAPVSEIRADLGRGLGPAARRRPRYATQALLGRFCDAASWRRARARPRCSLR